MMIRVVLFVFLAFEVQAKVKPDWSVDASIPITGRANPYELDGKEWSEYVEKGRAHLVGHPLDFTGLVLPYESIKKLVEAPADNPLRALIEKLFGGIASFHSMDELYAWIGLAPFPKPEDKGVYSVPYPNGKRPDYRLGIEFVKKHGATGITFGCASCHSAQLFGKTVLGMTNRFPRGSNDLIIKVKQAMKLVTPATLKLAAGATEGEIAIAMETKRALKAIGTDYPKAYGLDTAFAVMAGSLARRKDDPYLSHSLYLEDFPRPLPGTSLSADMKPPVWWNLKYKTRWMWDGSSIAGNPLITVLFWGEIMRSTNLKEFEKWMKDNERTIEEITAAAYATEAPRFNDFFPPTQDDLTRARRGEPLFRERCSKCHGIYEKGWSLADGTRLPLVEQLKTIRVKYHTKTPVVDVGTDPNRHKVGAGIIDRLNQTSVSKEAGLIVKAQKGYVPPPLVGIWVRWPYFHNNSSPSLCAVLTRHEERPKTYYPGEPIDKDRDFDRECNGYPLTGSSHEKWKKNPEVVFDTKKDGLSNSGHDEGIFLEDGEELLSGEQKKDLIAFLQTL